MLAAGGRRETARGRRIPINPHRSRSSRDGLLWKVPTKVPTPQAQSYRLPPGVPRFPCPAPQIAFAGRSIRERLDTGGTVPDRRALSVLSGLLSRY
jgi:hypothetical protein